MDDLGSEAPQEGQWTVTYEAVLREIQKARGKESVRLAKLREGDTVWWRTGGGSNYYFKLERIEKNKNPVNQHYYGTVAGFSETRGEIKPQNAILQGSSFPGHSSLDRLSLNRGMRVELHLMDQKKSWLTSRVEKLGVIKGKTSGWGFLKRK